MLYLGNMNTGPKVIVPEGTLLRMNSLGTKHDFDNSLCNFYINKTLKTCTLVHRNRYGKPTKILVTKMNGYGGANIYVYEDYETGNECELVLKTSLCEKMLASYEHHSFVAVTEEALDLPLEEQPWYLGQLTNEDKLKIAKDTPMRSGFFTYSRGGKFYLILMDNIVGKKNHGHVSSPGLQITSANIRSYIPTDKLILGIYNDGKPKNLAHHLAFNCVMQGDFWQAKRYIIDNDIDLSIAFDSPNILREYLTKTPKHMLNNELILWLIKKGAPVEASNYHASDTLKEAIENCNEKVIKAMIEHHNCGIGTVRLLLSRGVSYDLLKIAYLKQEYCGYYKEFLLAVSEGKFKRHQYAKRTFVMMAWKFGNSDNYFKLLPRELIDVILNYEDVDEPAYFPMLEFLLKNFGKRDPIVGKVLHWNAEALALFLPFFWEHWGKLFISDLANNIVKAISFCDRISNKFYGPTLCYWFKRITTSEKFKQYTLDIYSLNSVTRYSLSIPTEDALSMLKFLLEHNLTSRTELLKPIGRTGDIWFAPPTWFAVESGFIPTIKFLMDADLLPETLEDASNMEPKTLSDLYLSNPKLQHVRDFIEKYRKEADRQTK